MNQSVRAHKIKRKKSGVVNWMFGKRAEVKKGGGGGVTRLAHVEHRGDKHRDA